MLCLEGRKQSTNVQSSNRNWSLWYGSPWAASAWIQRGGCMNPNRRLQLQGQSYTDKRHVLNTFQMHSALIFRSAHPLLGKSLGNYHSMEEVHENACWLTNWLNASLLHLDNSILTWLIYIAMWVTAETHWELNWRWAAPASLWHCFPGIELCTWPGEG